MAERLVYRVGFKVYREEDRQVVLRKQLPLALAYAMQIHQAQGQNLSKVLVDIEALRNSGEATVALSRTTEWRSLWLKNFSAAKVLPHPELIAFNAKISTVSEALGREQQGG